jgi:DedD protein
MSLRYTGEATMDATALRDVERDVERWKDKVEVRLDNRQVFFLFFGSAMVACMLFVLGVIVGKRLESRGRAQAPMIEDPLAALDRFGVERAGSAAAPSTLTFPRALLAGGSPATSRTEHTGRPAAKAVLASTVVAPTPLTSATGAAALGAPPATPVNKKLAALPRPLAGQKTGAPAGASSTVASVTPAASSSPRETDEVPAPAAKVAAPAPAAKAGPAKVKIATSAPAAKIPGASPSPAKVAVTGAPVAKGTSLTPASPRAATPVPTTEPRASSGAIAPAKIIALNPFRPTAPAPLKATSPASSSDAGAKTGAAMAAAPARKGGFMLQLSSFQDRVEADAFARRFAAQNAYVTASEVPGKGTVYRVRVGSYSTMKEAANAKTSFEHDHNVIAYVAGSGPAN